MEHRIPLRRVVLGRGKQRRKSNGGEQAHREPDGRNRKCCERDDEAEERRIPWNAHPDEGHQHKGACGHPCGEEQTPRERTKRHDKSQPPDVDPQF